MTITAERPVTEPSVEDLAGVFNDVNSAVGAARRAFVAFSECSLAQRRAFVDAVREAATQQDRLEYMASAAVEETRMGNAHHKVLKNRYAATRTPGVEDLVIEAHQGDDGLTTLEYSPYGMLSAGNTVVFSPHPRARHLSAWLVDVLNRAMMATGAPANLITLIANPTPETTKKLISHPDITMLVATGGPQIVNMVLSSGKKAIGAGSGNPPVVVDETANIAKAAADIVQGASFDNNLPCTAEKEMIVVASVLPEFMAALQANGAQVISDREDLVKLRSLLLDPSGT